MSQFLGILRYTILKTLNNYYLWFLLSVSLVIMTIYLKSAEGINFSNAYPFYNAFNFLLILIIGAGIISGEISRSHIELIFTKPVKRSIYLLYKYISTIIVAFFMVSVFLVFSALIPILFHFFFNFSLPHFTTLLKLLLYLALNQITTFSLLFFISSWTLSTLDSFLLLGGVFFYPLINYFLTARFPSINNLLQTLRDILNPFKIEIFLSYGFSFPRLLFHFFIYSIFLLFVAILIVNKKEVSK